MKFDRQLFSAAIQAKLLECNLTGREAARAAGVSASTISRLTSGELLPDIETFATIVRWLGTDANVFLDAPRGGEMRDNEKWSWLVLCLNELEIPEELVKATVTILRLVAHPDQEGKP